MFFKFSTNLLFATQAKFMSSQWFYHVFKSVLITENASVFNLLSYVEILFQINWCKRYDNLLSSKKKIKHNKAIYCKWKSTTTLGGWEGACNEVAKDKKTAYTKRACLKPDMCQDPGFPAWEHVNMKRIPILFSSERNSVHTRVSSQFDKQNFCCGPQNMYFMYF